MTKQKIRLKEPRRKTLDQEHTERVNFFNNLKETLPHKKEKLFRLKKELVKIEKEKNSRNGKRIQLIIQLRDKIRILENEIEQIESSSQSLEYIAGALPILIDYYGNNNNVTTNDQIDKNCTKDGKNTDFLETIDFGDTKNFGSPTNGLKVGRNVLSYLIGKNLQTKEQTFCRPQSNHACLYQRYLQTIDPKNQYSSEQIREKCSSPGCPEEMILNPNDGCYVCPVCGLSEFFLVNQDKPKNKEFIMETNTYAYKRINHLTEILNQLQAKETTDIPSKVYHDIFRELKKRKINKNDLDFFKLRRILKKLNYRKYYEHVSFILQAINGKEPPNFSRQDEIRIKQLFRQIQEPFTLFCPKNRKNFLNYSYVLHKFCELLDLDEYIGYFPLLKNNAKLLQHDKIWKNICQYMKWKFYKSI
jgi:uncharacterized Zn finger protein (UPF0148 family)